MSNYRPISLLTTFSKIFEIVVFNRIKHHIDANNVFAQEQYGFRTKSSSEIATYNLVNNALLALYGKLSVGGLFCDLAKAFDSVNHTVLLSKLEFYGINGSIGKLIKSCLNDRYQRTLWVFRIGRKLGKVCHRVQYLAPYSSFYILMTCLI
jgi:hypothetical protein